LVDGLEAAPRRESDRRQQPDQDAPLHRDAFLPARRVVWHQPIEDRLPRFGSGPREAGRQVRVREDVDLQRAKQQQREPGQQEREGRAMHPLGRLPRTACRWRGQRRRRRKISAMRRPMPSEDERQRTGQHTSADDPAGADEREMFVVARRER
jgi:hypothetical protein